MHESSLIEFTLNAVEKRAQEMGMTKVNLIHLTCGQIRGAIPVLMQESFRFLAYQRDMFQDAILEIAETPTIVKCRVCGVESPINDFSNITCPACNSDQYDIVSGDELRIDFFDGE